MKNTVLFNIKQPSISVIIPVYNSQKYLRCCLDSIINQTLKNIEIICVDDGSVDNSLDILKEYEEKDSRIKLITSKNYGVSHARNLGLDAATGEYIGFCDSDDYVDLDYYETLYDYSKKTKYDIIRGIRVIGKNAHGKNEYGCIIPSIIKQDFLLKTKIKFREDMKKGEDSNFKHRLYDNHPQILEAPDTKSYYHYVKREGSLSSYILNEKPLVSVILTVYEIKKDYLEECLKSILQQTYENIEILVMNDCSPKTNYDWVEKLSDKIILVKNKTNLGMNKTVNKAITLASGKYIVRLGSDDIFDKELIEKEVTILEKNEEYGAVCCELQRFDVQDEKINYQGIIHRPEVWDLRSILDKNLAGTGYDGGMMWRSCLKNKIYINESYKICEDFDFHLQLLEISNITSIHEVLYFYRSHETNICKSVNTQERWKIINTILDSHRKNLKQTQKNSIITKKEDCSEMFDLVYIVKKDEKNEDLRYSLRSVAKFVPYRKIWIVGYKPSWITNVEYIPVEQNGNKWENSVKNILTACDNKDISEDFILMNDDFFAIKPIKNIEDSINVSLGILKERLNNYNGTSRWQRAFKFVVELLEEMNIKEPYYDYESHTPLIINKKKFLEVMNAPEVLNFRKTKNVLHKRSLYKNIDKITPKTLEQDVKVSLENDDTLIKANVCDWLSVYDNQVGNKNFPDLNNLLKELFPDPCEFETQQAVKVVKSYNTKVGKGKYF